MHLRVTYIYSKKHMTLLVVLTFFAFCKYFPCILFLQLSECLFAIFLVAQQPFTLLSINSITSHLSNRCIRGFIFNSVR